LKPRRSWTPSTPRSGWSRTLRTMPTGTIWAQSPIKTTPAD